MGLFIVIVVTLIVVAIIFILLLLASNSFYPFKKMNKDDIDDCYGNTGKPKNK